MIKRLPLCLFAFIMLIASHAHAADIYVAPNGSDSNPGSKDQPLATLANALRKARELRRLNDASIAGGIHIILSDGTYTLYEPVFIRPEDAGTAASPTYIEAMPGEQPVLSGASMISAWLPTFKKIPGLPQKAQGKVWVANVPLVNGNFIPFRQLWINNVKAIRARDRNADSMYRILSWNKAEQTCWIPTPKTLSLQAIQGIEMFIHQWWAVATLRIKKMEAHGDSSKLFFHQPESKIQSEHPWPAPWISSETGNSAFYLTNALQFLDEPGEWYLDVVQRKVYYWPRNGEDLPKSIVNAPAMETLVNVEGTIDQPVSHISFKGISFEHTGWLRPSQYGHVPHQAGMYMLDAYKLRVPGTPDKKSLENQAWVGRPAAAVKVNFADSIQFQSCSFQHLASTGLDMEKGNHDCVVNGNLFKDIGGTALLAGVFSDEATEVHIPYQPKDDREVCAGLMISNNLITQVTNEDWGCVGIGAGYVKETTITHNEIADVSYSGISMGWGWTKTSNVMKNNRITANRIHHYGKHNYDVAAVYTLSAQPGTLISENYIDSIYKAPYAHIPSHWFYLYTDEGSSGITVKDNWCPSGKFLQNANGPGNTWENNGPRVAGDIKKNAGVSSTYQSLLKEKYVTAGWPINYETPTVVEMVAGEDQKIDKSELTAVLTKYKIPEGSLYQWGNHYVIFGKVPDVGALKGALRNQFKGAAVRSYDDLFYEFNREHCTDKQTTENWEHILLTANLVADTKMQQEYLAYHATQFTKWPEVSEGFCNANFQQLLVYRNGRQLMLVISIPKGETLDNLNPKTTANNPRMEEWNRLMGKYQEGIKGAKPGEVWVFLNKIN
jgi:hypothetical protein